MIWIILIEILQTFGKTMKNLNGKTGIVTGISRGIGVHIVDVLTRNGVNVIGIARSAYKIRKSG